MKFLLHFTTLLAATDGFELPRYCVSLLRGRGGPCRESWEKRPRLSYSVPAVVCKPTLLAAAAANVESSEQTEDSVGKLEKDCAWVVENNSGADATLPGWSREDGLSYSHLWMNDMWERHVSRYVVYVVFVLGQGDDLLSGICRLVFAVWYLPSGICCLVFAVWYLPSGICRLSLSPPRIRPPGICPSRPRICPFCPRICCLVSVSSR